MLLRVLVLSGKKGKVSFPEHVVKCFNTFACLSEGGENDNEFSPPGVCSSRVPVLKTLFLSLNGKTRDFVRMVRGLEGMLRVRKSLEGDGGCASGQHSGHSSAPGNASSFTGENDSGGQMSASSLAGAVGPLATADESKGIIELHESELSKRADVLADRCPPCAGRSREQARAQKWCIDSGAGDARRVSDAMNDARSRTRQAPWFLVFGLPV